MAEREAEEARLGESAGGFSDQVSRSAVDVCGFLTGVLLSILSSFDCTNNESLARIGNQSGKNSHTQIGISRIRRRRRRLQLSLKPKNKKSLCERLWCWCVFRQRVGSLRNDDNALCLI